MKRDKFDKEIFYDYTAELGIHSFYLFYVINYIINLIRFRNSEKALNTTVFDKFFNDMDANGNMLLNYYLGEKHKKPNIIYRYFYIMRYILHDALHNNKVVK